MPRDQPIRRTRRAGSLLAWGYNGAGDLGDNTTTSSSLPVAVSAGAIALGTTFTQIAAGGSDSLALSRLGSSTPGATATTRSLGTT
jgi:alpha-tubulin suppressor-like RCC1 family protein